MSGTAGGVASEGSNVYAMRTSGSQVTVLHADTGQRTKTITLNAMNSGDRFSTIAGGFFVVKNRLFRGARNDRRFYRFVLCACMNIHS